MRGNAMLALFLATLNTFYVQEVSTQDEHCVPKPFYNIAHMQNSLFELNKALTKGANAAEVDVHYLPDGTADVLYHGAPCDCMRNCESYDNFTTYFERVRDLTTPSHPDYNKQLVFFYLDTKASHLGTKEMLYAGEDMARKLINHLWNGGNGTTVIRLLLYVQSYREADLIRGFIKYFHDNGVSHLLSRIGFEIGGASDDYLLKVGTGENIWKGDGISNCLSYFWSYSRVRKFMKERDQGLGNVKKVYFWTIDLSNQIMDAIRMGLDGLITNYPERIVSLLKEPEFKCIARLATLDDDPFERIVLPKRKHHRHTSKNRSSVEEVFSAIVNYLQQSDKE